MITVILVMGLSYMLGFSTCYFFLNRYWKQDIKDVSKLALAYIIRKIDGV